MGRRDGPSGRPPPADRDGNSGDVPCIGWSGIICGMGRARNRGSRPPALREGLYRLSAPPATAGSPAGRKWGGPRARGGAAGPPSGTTICPRQRDPGRRKALAQHGPPSFATRPVPSKEGRHGRRSFRHPRHQAGTGRVRQTARIAVGGPGKELRIKPARRIRCAVVRVRCGKR